MTLGFGMACLLVCVALSQEERKLVVHARHRRPDLICRSHDAHRCLRPPSRTRARTAPDRGVPGSTEQRAKEHGAGPARSATLAAGGVSKRWGVGRHYCGWRCGTNENERVVLVWVGLGEPRLCAQTAPCRHATRNAHHVVCRGPRWHLGKAVRGEAEGRGECVASAWC
jgi:hypothetical protein